MLKDGVDYELFASDDPDDLAWNVRILTGDFVETTIRYGNIVADGVNECLRYNFDILFSPIPELTPEDTDIQYRAGEILEAILVDAHESGTLQTKDIT